MMVMIEIILIIEMILMMNFQSTSVTFCDVLRITSPNKMNASGDLEMKKMMMILMIIVHDDSDVDNDRDDVYDDDASDDDDSDDDRYNYDRHSDSNDDRIITYKTLFYIPWVKRCNFS